MKLSLEKQLENLNYNYKQGWINFKRYEELKEEIIKEIDVIKNRGEKNEA